MFRHFVLSFNYHFRKYRKYMMIKIPYEKYNQTTAVNVLKETLRFRQLIYNWDFEHPKSPDLIDLVDEATEIEYKFDIDGERGRGGFHVCLANTLANKYDSDSYTGYGGQPRRLHKFPKETDFADKELAVRNTKFLHEVIPDAILAQTTKQVLPFLHLFFEGRVVGLDGTIYVVDKSEVSNHIEIKLKGNDPNRSINTCAGWPEQPYAFRDVTEYCLNSYSPDYSCVPFASEMMTTGKHAEHLAPIIKYHRPGQANEFYVQTHKTVWFRFVVSDMSCKRLVLRSSFPRRKHFKTCVTQFNFNKKRLREMLFRPRFEMRIETYAFPHFEQLTKKQSRIVSRGIYLLPAHLRLNIFDLNLHNFEESFCRFGDDYDCAVNYAVETLEYADYTKNPYFNHITYAHQRSNIRSRKFLRPLQIKTMTKKRKVLNEYLLNDLVDIVFEYVSETPSLVKAARSFFNYHQFFKSFDSTESSSGIAIYFNCTKNAYNVWEVQEEERKCSELVNRSLNLEIDTRTLRRTKHLATLPYRWAFQELAERLSHLIPLIGTVFGGGVLYITENKTLLISRNVNGYVIDLDQFLDINAERLIQYSFLFDSCDIIGKALQEYDLHWKAKLHGWVPEIEVVDPKWLEENLFEAVNPINRKLDRYEKLHNFLDPDYRNAKLQALINEPIKAATFEEIAGAEMAEKIKDGLSVPVVSKELTYEWLNLDMDFTTELQRRTTYY